MATVHISFATANARSDTGSSMPVVAMSSGTRLMDLTTSGTSAKAQATGGGDWTAPRDGFVFVDADAAVIVVSGTTPVASAINGVRVPANFPMSFSINAGEKIAAVNA